MLKKILPLLLAVVMIFSLGAVTAFAEPERQDATLDTNTVKIGKTYKLLNAGTKSPKETFYLIQTGKTSVDSSVTGEAIPDLVALTGEDAAGYPGTGRLVGTTTFAEGAATVSGLRQDITVGLPAYTAVGVYTYTLKEVDSATAGVLYWTHPIELVITVMADDDGKFYVEAVHCEEKVADDENQNDKTDNFTNIYRANGVDPGSEGVRIEKEVTGTLGDRDKYFNFSITFEAEAGKNYSTAPAVTVNGGTHDTNPETVDLTELTEENPITVTFQLKHGETIAFGNVPYGVTYTYEETDAGTDGYDTTYSQKETGEVDPETNEPVTEDDVTGVIDSIKNEHKVTNDKDRDIDTGVLLDNLPYIMALAIVMIGGAVFFVSKKRRNAEDLA